MNFYTFLKVPHISEQENTNDYNENIRLSIGTVNNENCKSNYSNI